MPKVYLRVTMIRGNKSIGEDAMLYPAIYNPSEVDQNKLGPIVYEGAFSRGEAIEECLIFIEAAVADRYATNDPRRFAILNEREADTWLGANKQLANQPEERVTDPNRIQAILAKNVSGVALSQEDLYALDPDNPMQGINRRPKTAKGIFGV